MVVIGPDLGTTLFGRTTNLTGQSIRLNGQTFTIIGALKAKGNSALGSSDNQAIIPITTARDRVIQRAGDQVDTIYIQATSTDTVSQSFRCKVIACATVIEEMRLFLPKVTIRLGHK